MKSGFGSYQTTEAIEGALPAGRNSPQRVPFDLYAEQLSATAFTAPRDHNTRGGAKEIHLPSGETRRFLEDSDEIIFEGFRVISRIAPAILLR